jgi:hypothetical protein
MYGNSFDECSVPGKVDYTHHQCRLLTFGCRRPLARVAADRDEEGKLIFVVKSLRENLLTRSSSLQQRRGRRRDRPPR